MLGQELQFRSLPGSRNPIILNQFGPRFGQQPEVNSEGMPTRKDGIGVLVKAYIFGAQSHQIHAIECPRFTEEKTCAHSNGQYDGQGICAQAGGGGIFRSLTRAPVPSFKRIFLVGITLSRRQGTLCFSYDRVQPVSRSSFYSKDAFGFSQIRGYSSTLLLTQS